MRTNEFNNFFCRFETRDFSQEQKAVLHLIPALGATEIMINQQVVKSLFSCICSRKTRGLDGISGRLLKSSSKGLVEAWCPIYQRFHDTNCVAATRKSSIIIPVLKKVSCQKNNDLLHLPHLCLGKAVINLLKTDNGAGLIQLLTRCSHIS